MDTRNRIESFAHSNSFHEEQLPFFDAYATNELDEDKRIQIEQNLQHCLECQRLFAEITHLRRGLGTLLETENPAIPTHMSQSILQAVMTRIEQGENQGDYLSAKHAKQVSISSRPRSVAHPALFTGKRAGAIYLSLGAAACCIILLASLIIMHQKALPSSVIGRATPVIGGAVPARLVWAAQPLLLVQNSAGVFALKEIEITTGKEFRFYYAFQSSRQGNIYASAISSLNAGQQPVTLHTSVLPLGMIDGISVGVIRVQYLDRVGQTITLTITSQEEGSSTWKLAPLKQLFAEPHPQGGGYYGLYVDQHLFPEIVWSGPRSGTAPQPMISLFKNAAGTHYVYLEVDYAGKIVIITKEQCIQLVGEQICH